MSPGDTEEDPGLMRALRVVMATDAEPLYQPLGWETVAREPYGGESVTIMRKRLGTS